MGLENEDFTGFGVKQSERAFAKFLPLAGYQTTARRQTSQTACDSAFISQ